MVTFFLSPKNLTEPKVKSFGLLMLELEMSGQPHISRVAWLLVVTLREIYNEKKPITQREIRHAQFE